MRQSSRCRSRKAKEPLRLHSAVFRFRVGVPGIGHRSCFQWRWLPKTMGLHLGGPVYRCGQRRSGHWSNCRGVVLSTWCTGWRSWFAGRIWRRHRHLCRDDAGDPRLATPIVTATWTACPLDWKLSRIRRALRDDQVSQRPAVPVRRRQAFATAAPADPLGPSHRMLDKGFSPRHLVAATMGRMRTWPHQYWASPTSDQTYGAGTAANVSPTAQ